ncbi:transposase [Streptomyces sp. NPDC000351]|uniref:transposase n=1 Tax=Streptomyces sp. NPDC000351 TaxID=3154250 RepID=UPI003333199D
MEARATAAGGTRRNSSGTRSASSVPPRTVTEVVRELGVSAEGLRNWVRQDQADRGQGRRAR